MRTSLKQSGGGLILVNDNAESRRTVEFFYKRHKTTLNPIIEWTDADVWNFIRKNNIPYCELYDQGWSRLGCIGCPMASTNEREREFARWPRYKEAYFRAFDRMLKRYLARGKVWRKEGFNGMAAVEDIFNWWMGYDILPGQITLDDYLQETDEDE